METTKSDDRLTQEEDGEMGQYQIFVLLLLLVDTLVKVSPHFAFIFTAGNLAYRCKIPQCDNQSSSIEYEPHWLSNAIPYDDKNKPKNCEKYQLVNSTRGECLREQFDRNVTETCREFVYSSDRRTILADFNLHCDDHWKLTQVGTINSIGLFVGMPIAGYLSDSFGRRTVLICGTIACAILGIIQSFSINYIMFVTFEFLQSLVSAGTFISTFNLVAELVGPDKRALATTLLYCSVSIGEALTATFAWLVPSWRTLLIIYYSPLFLCITYVWLLPESVRWLLSRGRTDDAQKILAQAAKINQKSISQQTLDKLKNSTVAEDKLPYLHVFKSKILTCRLVVACFCWITCACLFYGLTINSVALADNHFVNLILIALIEIPAFGSIFFIVDRFGRKKSIAGMYFIAAISCLVFVFVGEDQYIIRICLYMLAKFGTTAAFGIIYIISSELFPTPLRSSLMGICSMFGRIGNIVATEVPLLRVVWTPLPTVLFSSIAAIAGALSLLFPETSKVKLPDTIQEAEDIGKKV